MQPSTSAQALQGLQSAQASAQDPNSILQAQQQQLGVNSAQQTVTGLRGAINNTTKLLSQVAPSVMGRTGSSLVTNAQATRQIGNEQAPISANLTQEGTDYNNANSDLTRLQGEAQAAASGIYQGQQDKLSYAQNLYNTLYQQEQDKQAESDRAAALAEQSRQANLSAKTSGGGGGTFNLGGGNTPSAPAANPQQVQAQTALTSLFKTNDVNLIAKTINAITDSANRGNAYDKLKLQLLEQYANTNYGNILNKAQGLIKNNKALRNGAGGRA